MNTPLRIAGIGEILMDVFEDGTATVGGAPVNVAFHAHQLLTHTGRGEGVVLSAVGEDGWGHYLLDWMAGNGISSRHVARDPRRPTGIATVFVRDGEAGYDIAPDVAWDDLPESAAPASLAQACSAVAFGSLAQRTAGSAETIRRFVSAVDGPRLYDVNLRRNATDGVRGYSAEILQASCRLATLVKANSGELEEVVELLGLPPVAAQGEERLWAQMAQLKEAYELSAVVITRGALGSLLLGVEGRVQLADSTLPLEKVHPVGAGDAFAAGLLFGLCLGYSLPVSAALADRLAISVTQSRSATPALDPAVLAGLP